MFWKLFSSIYKIHLKEFLTVLDRSLGLVVYIIIIIIIMADVYCAVVLDIVPYST